MKTEKQSADSARQELVDYKEKAARILQVGGMFSSLHPQLSVLLMQLIISSLKKIEMCMSISGSFQLGKIS